MDKVKAVEEEWRRCFNRLAQGEFLLSLSQGRFTRRRYLGFLKETYHNASWNPRLGSLFHAHLDSQAHALEARFLKHNASEVGHADLALADLAALGEDADAVKRSRPLPATEAMAGFIAFQIQHRHPLSYLGYLYHLEAIATGVGESAIQALSALGIPSGAMGFLREHAEADMAHMQHNRAYLDGFIRTTGDLDAVVYGLQGACALHGLMFQGILGDSRESG